MLYVIRSKPSDFVRNVGDAILIYPLPASDYIFLEGNRKSIAFLTKAHNAVFYGSVKEGQIGLLIVYSLVLSTGFGAYLAVRWIRRKPGDAAYATTVMFIWFTIIYVTAVVNLFEIEENNRIRFMIEPYLMLMLGVIFDRFRRYCLKKT
jgi:hypothetical protein